MEAFDVKCTLLFDLIGNYKKMVLSTALNNKVTSRMMSVVISNQQFYFQTDKISRKYEQLQKNHNASLCIDNIQIEGICTEIGHPLDNQCFSNLYKEYYKASYDKYSSLSNERLFEMKPVFIQKWIYIDGEPYVEIYDFIKKSYEKKPYIGE